MTSINALEKQDDDKYHFSSLEKSEIILRGTVISMIDTYSKELSYDSVQNTGLSYTSVS